MSEATPNATPAAKWMYLIFAIGLAAMPVSCGAVAAFKDRRVSLVGPAIAGALGIVGTIAFLTGRRAFLKRYSPTVVYVAFAPLNVTTVCALALVLSFGAAWLEVVNIVQNAERVFFIALFGFIVLVVAAWLVYHVRER